LSAWTTTGTRRRSSATISTVVPPDKDAEGDGDLRVVDESSEEYLFSADRFVPSTSLNLSKPCR
jgi:hypothetical protein